MANTAYYEQLTRDAAAARFGEGSRMATIGVAMLRQESRDFDPRVWECVDSSSAGAEGGGQIMRRFWEQEVEPCDPSAAAAWAMMHFERLTATFGGNPRAGCAAYNAGQGAIAALKAAYGYGWETGDIPGKGRLPAETRAYLRICMADALLRIDPGEHDGMIAPFRGAYLTQPYGMTDFARFGSAENGWKPGYGGGPHTGLDWGGGAEGDLVCAAFPGTVLFAGWNGNYGFQVVYDRDGWPDVTLSVAHLAGTTVFPGNRVRAGTVLGYLGTTGYSTAVHTHGEVRWQNTPVEPGPGLAEALQLFRAESTPPPVLPPPDLPPPVEPPRVSPPLVEAGPSPLREALDLLTVQAGDLDERAGSHDHEAARARQQAGTIRETVSRVGRG